MKEDREVEQSPVKGVTGNEAWGERRVDVLLVMGMLGSTKKSNAAPATGIWGRSKRKDSTAVEKECGWWKWLVVSVGLLVLLKERKLRKIRGKKEWTVKVRRQLGRREGMAWVVVKKRSGLKSRLQKGGSKRKRGAVRVEGQTRRSRGEKRERAGG